MKRYYVLGLAIFLAACTTPACNCNDSTLVQGNPEDVGMSSTRLENMDRYLQMGVDSGFYVGVAAMIVRDGKVIYEKGFGNAEDGKPLTTDAIFRIASQTKAITSTAAMILWEEGKFLLDDPLSKYLPEFSDLQVLETFNEGDSSYTAVTATKTLTIRHLLTHTSGLDYYGFGSTQMRSIYAKNGMPAIFGSDQDNLADFSVLSGKMPLKHEPGAAFSYGINVDILGRLIEVFSGQSLDDFFRSRILDPLGMNDTYFYLPSDKESRLVPVYNRTSDGFVEMHGSDEFGVGVDYPLSEGTFYSGGAGLSSTLKDYAIFLQMMLNGGEYNGVQILSRRTVDLMTSNQIGELMVGKNKFGLGFLIKTEEGQKDFGESEGSFSWGGYYGTTYWADPKEKIIGLCFVNQRGGIPGNLHDKFRVLTYAALDD